MDKKNSGQDEYLSLSKYEGRPTSDEHKGFSSFEHEGEHYFAMLSKSGAVQMRSEGYSSSKSRDNGIASVKKNRGLKERWSVNEEQGKYVIALKAGNHQEIARSGAFKNKAEAEAALAAYLGNGTPWGAGAAVAAAGIAAGGGSDKGKGANKNVLTEEDKEDDYLPTKEYEGHPINDKKNNIAHFKHENGQYYFALYNKEGKVKLRSEGFETAKNRDKELSGVLKYHNDDKMYTTLERGKFYMMVLKDETGREVGRSPLLKKAKAAPKAAAAPPVKDKGKSKSSGAGKVAAAGALGLTGGKIVSENIISSSVISESRSNTGKETRNVISEKRNATGKETRNVLSEKRNVLKETKSKIKEDDYLKCEAYKGHTITDTKNRIAKFKGKDGQFYFAAYYKDGSVRLRSEGFATEKGREDELKHAIKHLETAKSYSTIKKGKYYINVLKDGTGREVGRSCMSTSVQNLITPIPVPIPPPVVKKVEKKVEKKVVAAKPVKKTPPPPPPKKVVPVAAAVAAPAAAAAAGGSSAWGCLKWLIPLLLLLLLLWWLFAIKGCGAAAPVAAVVPPPPPPPVVVEKVVPPPPPVVKTCNCAGLTHPAFKLPSGPAQKVTTKLGLAPEFGKSSSLDPEGFYNKLKRRYAASATDRVFLDGIFKQMGYKGGFKDANASLFSNTNIPNGVSGNLGMKQSHVSVFRKMNLRNASERSAFKIEAANACHMHFMKECGNHFFYGPCN